MTWHNDTQIVKEKGKQWRAKAADMVIFGHVALASAVVVSTMYENKPAKEWVKQQ